MGAASRAGGGRFQLIHQGRAGGETLLGIIVQRLLEYGAITAWKQIEIDARLSAHGNLPGIRTADVPHDTAARTARGCKSRQVRRYAVEHLRVDKSQAELIGGRSSTLHQYRSRFLARRCAPQIRFQEQLRRRIASIKTASGL